MERIYLHIYHAAVTDLGLYPTGFTENLQIQGLKGFVLLKSH